MRGPSVPRWPTPCRRALLGPGLWSLGLLSAMVGGFCSVRVGWVELKRHAAEILISRAFDAQLREGVPHLPWRWADVAPIAELRVDRLGIRRHVLSGGSGTSMAFGVGHLDGSAPPNRPGNCVLVGHRDTALGFLRRVRVGDRLRLQSAEGCRPYEVIQRTVVHERDLRVVMPSTDRRVTLLTCFPFDGYGPTAWRLAVVAVECARQRRPKGALTVCSQKGTTSRGVGPSTCSPGAGGDMSTYSDTATPTNPYRTVSYDAAAADLRSRPPGRDTTTAAALSHASMGFIHHVPVSLMHIGCMWLENGDERCRCGEQPSWTMGSSFDAPRLYCEEHAQRILARRLRERDMQRQRRLRMQAHMSLS